MLLELLSVLGPVGVAVLLAVLGLLSQRLGTFTGTAAYYRWAYLAAGLAAVSAAARLAAVFTCDSLDCLWVDVYTVGLAVSVTLGVLVAWRYWQWLFSDRGG